MHYHLEIIMPQVEDIEVAVADILRNLSEDNDEGYPGFYDWYVVGGRWAGTKLTDSLDSEKLEQFYDELKAKKVTVSGLQCGKQEISPADQIPLVDSTFSKYFPEYKNRACPLFNHSNNQYTNDCLYGDVLRIKDLPESTTCSRLIIAGIDYSDKELEAKYMLSGEIWNGVNHQKTTWDGKLDTGLKMYAEYIKNYKEEYRQKHTVTDDWLAVTVDYHS